MKAEAKTTIFKELQKNAVHIGIDRKQLTTKYRLNEKSLMCFFVLGILVICSDMYFFHLAKNFREYTESFYITSMSNAGTLVFLIAIWKMNVMFQFIDNCERITVISEQFN